MTVKFLLLFNALISTFLLVESIQFFASDSVINPLQESQVYNNQAFNLINLLNRINADDPGSLRTAANGNKHLQNTQQDFRGYVKSKNNLFNYSNWPETSSLPYVQNVNSQGVTNSSETFNQKFPSFKVAGLSEDEEFRKKIADFKKENHDFNEKKFSEISSVDQIKTHNSVNETYSAIIDRINKAQINNNGSLAVDDPGFFDSKLKCFNCSQLKTERECSEFGNFSAKQIINIFCCQCNQFRKKQQETTVGYIKVPSSDLDQATTLNYFEQAVNDSNKETDSEWTSYFSIFLIFMLFFLVCLIAYWVYKCCKKSRSKNSDTQIEKLVIDDPKNQIDEKEQPDGKVTFPDNNPSENIASKDENPKSNTSVNKKNNNELNQDQIKMEYLNYHSVKPPDENFMPQCARCSSTQMLEKCSYSAEQFDLDSNSKDPASSCSSCSALNNKNLKTNILLNRNDPVNKKIENQQTSKMQKQQSTLVNGQSKKTYVRYCQTATKK